MLHACACSAKRVVFSRAYINFTNPDSVPEFKQAFDGHLFVGTKGNQYRCAVEYAPYQKMPVAAAKKDPRDGTIVKGKLQACPLLHSCLSHRPVTSQS